MLNGKKTIGVLVFDITSYYQENICHYLTEYGNSAGFNVVVFTACTIYGNRSSNSDGEFNIIHLVPYEDLDALVICHDTFNNDYVVDDVWNLVKERVTCPVFSMRKKMDKYYSILINDKDSIPCMVRHFSEVHHFTKIAFMTGPLYHNDAIYRLERFKETMNQLGLEVPDEYIFEGDFWINKGKEAATHFTSLANPPEAIVCSNDYMALSLSRELILQNHMVPDDFAVSGFDDIREANGNMPPLTTCAVSVPEMALAVINSLKKLFNDETIETCQYIEATPVIRNSCGCKITNMHDMIITRMKEMNKYDALLTSSIHNTFTSIALETIEYARDLRQYLVVEEAFKDVLDDFYLCLGEVEAPHYPRVRIPAPGFAEESRSIYSLQNLQPIQTSTFKTRDLIPPEAVTEKPMALFFFPLHYLQFNFGYVAVSYHDHAPCGETFHSWLSIIGNAFESIRVKHESSDLLDQLHRLYIQDPLTELYNRRGFEQLANEAFAKANENKQNTMILGIDMDNLKTINDVYGHDHGDIALKTIGKAMKSAAKHNEICARVGGDEFEVFGIDYNEHMAEEFIQKFNAYLDDFNANSGLEYRVTASTGYSISLPNRKHPLDFYVKLSDDRLYEQKRHRKALYGDLSLRTN